MLYGHSKKSRSLMQVIWDNKWKVLRFYPKMIWMSIFSKHYTEEERYEYAMKMVDVVMESTDVSVDVHGSYEIPKDEAVFVCSNHQDKYDALAIWKAFPGNLGVVIDDKATKQPIVHEMVSLVRMHRLEKFDLRSMYRVIEDVIADLKEDLSVLIFPEGKYTDDYSKVLPFQAGCFKGAMKAHKPILPVALINSFKVFDGETLPPYTIEVRFLDPIFPEEYEGMKTRDVAQIVHDRIQSAVDRYQT